MASLDDILIAQFGSDHPRLKLYQTVLAEALSVAREVAPLSHDKWALQNARFEQVFDACREAGMPLKESRFFAIAFSQLVNVFASEVSGEMDAADPLADALPCEMEREKIRMGRKRT